MELGASGYTRRGRVFLLVAFATFLIVTTLMVGRAAAQQPVDAAQPGQITPTEVPPSQPPARARVSAAGATSGGQTQTSEAAKSNGDPAGMAQLGPGDLVEINVYNVPELNTKARVSNSGDLYLPLVDYVHVAGLTLEEAQSVVEKRLEEGGFVRSPHVTIFVDEANSQGVTILGEVGKPGVYSDPADRKLYELISEAGGFTENAARKIAVIRRNQPEPIRVDLPRNLADDLSGNIDIQPGDTINVPRAPIIYVVGDVGRPSGLLVNNGSLTVLQAIALAGGANHTAKLGAVRIIRKTPAGMTETRVELKRMLEAKTPDITLEADDILFVPVSGGRVLAGRTLEAAIAMATAVSIYAVHP
jgi:polysaccharide export outer membrane protein